MTSTMTLGKVFFSSRGSSTNSINRVIEIFFTFSDVLNLVLFCFRYRITLLFSFKGMHRYMPVFDTKI